MKQCAWQFPDDWCFNNTEGNTDYCGSHNRIIRKQAENDRKESENLRKRKMMAPKPKRVPVNKVSDKRKSENEIYKEKREAFLLGRWCAYHGHPCIPTTVHHQKGRTGTLFLDERFWIPLCMEAHTWVEMNPNEAKEKGLSLSRLVKDENGTI